jgi:predicted nucleic acid-binding protein
MRVFLDTNVIAGMLDAERHDHADCRDILRAMESRRIVAVLTGMTVVNALYAVRKAGLPRERMLAFASYLLTVAEVASMDLPELQAAIDSGWADFEDAAQYQAAVGAGGVKAIITSDRSGFKRSRLQVLTPERFVGEHLQHP